MLRLNNVNNRSERLTLITSLRFIPNPSPTTETWRRSLESFSAIAGNGCAKIIPNAKPKANAIGGDARGLVTNRRPITKRNFVDMIWFEFARDLSSPRASIRRQTRVDAIRYTIQQRIEMGRFHHSSIPAHSRPYSLV